MLSKSIFRHTDDKFFVPRLGQDGMSARTDFECAFFSCPVMLFSVSQHPMDSMIFVPSDLIRAKLINSKKHILAKPQYILATTNIVFEMT
jgi:hypothetical protein